MGSREITRGSIATQVSQNVAELRRKRGMSLSQLSEAMESVAGRPILASGLGKIETGERRVDVDDLVALAIALDVSPVRLLLPRLTSEEAGAEGASRETLEVDLHRAPGPGDFVLPSGGSVPWTRAWSWACGDEPLWGLDRSGDWEEENRPPVPRHPSAAELQQLAERAREAALVLERAAAMLQQAGQTNAETSSGALAKHHALEAGRGRRRG